jgi:quercetin dioxygenase-like cupin family protein
MKRALVAISLVAVVSTVVLAQEPTVLPQADAAKYAPAPFPPGAQQAIIVGNPKNAEGYVIRVKLAKGTKVAPHMHPNDENVTVISGTFHLGVGEQFDEAKGQMVKTGGYVNVPKGKPHFAWVSEDSVIQLHGVGPAGATFVNPADAPK